MRSFVIASLLLTLGVAFAHQAPGSFSGYLECVDEDVSLEIPSSSFEGFLEFELRGSKDYDLAYDSDTLADPRAHLRIEIDYRTDEAGGAKICHRFESTDDPALNHTLCVDAAPLFADRMLSWVHEAYSNRAAFRSRCLLTWTD